MTGSNVHDFSYYRKCMAGGILSCGITHTIVCPLDIVKCRMQVSIGTIKTASKILCRVHMLTIFSANRLAPVSTSLSVTVSARSRLLKASRVSPSAGCLLSSVTPLRASVNSVSMRSSRMFTLLPLVRTPPSIRPSVGLSPLLVLSSSLMFCSAPGKP